MPITGDISLYIHIPFCRKKCPYCHFYVLPNESRSQTVLLDALKLEWARYQPLTRDCRLVSIYFGGGTPFLIGPQSIEEILSWIVPKKGTEITLEANPGETTVQQFREFLHAGINRVSLGVQSFDNSLLKMLGRLHTAEEARRATLDASSAGIDNISIDLMYEIPGQTLESWKKTLNQVKFLPVQHLSLYNLTFEPRTVFFKRQASLTPLLPSKKEALMMLQMAVDVFELNNFKRYEISAFAKKNHLSMHNIGYWQGRPFLGLGPSAFSYWEGRRYQNYSDLKKYATALKMGEESIGFEERLSPRGSLHERLAIHLRMLEGVDMNQYPISPLLYKKLEKKGWILIEKGRARLSEQGKLFYDSLAEEIILIDDIPK